MASVNWDAYNTLFQDGLFPGTDIVSTVFIIAVAFAGLWIARWMYSQL